MKLLTICLLPLALAGCKASCEDASYDIIGAYEDCGEQAQWDPMEECQESDAELYACYADCYVEADCVALKNDEEVVSEELKLAECLNNCAK